MKCRMAGRIEFFLILLAEKLNPLVFWILMMNALSLIPPTVVSAIHANGVSLQFPAHLIKQPQVLYFRFIARVSQRWVSKSVVSNLSCHSFWYKSKFPFPRREVPIRATQPRSSWFDPTATAARCGTDTPCWFCIDSVAEDSRHLVVSRTGVAHKVF